MEMILETIFIAIVIMVVAIAILYAVDFVRTYLEDTNDKVARILEILKEEESEEFSYKPINPFQNDGLSSDDRVMIAGMRNTAYVCGYIGEDVEFAVHQALKRMGRTDLIPSCEQEESEDKQ